MAPRLMLFFGAPPPSSLSWNQDDLLDTFIDPIAQLLGIDSSNPDPKSTSSTSTDPQWRSLPLDRKQLTTGLTQDFDQHQLFTGYPQSQGDEGASFFTTSQVEFEISQSQLPGDSFASTQAQISQVLSQFYEESYARHVDVPSSQIAPASEGPASFTSDECSFTSASFESSFRATAQIREAPIAGRLTNIRDVPRPEYLDSIQPQTMTVNLIVGIISMPQPRGVKTRRGDSVSLVEVLVGDETKSGFGVNFWLSSSRPVEGDMRSVLEGLRPQDVVLMRNVALNSFKGRVYGQSLRKEMTKVHLLYRNRVNRTDVGGCYGAADLVSGDGVHPQVEKTRRVREWVLKFVGGGAAVKAGGMGSVSEIMNETLPPDTQ
ncbi:uncharacterized protein L3040_004294 [Drepanopeziza brunnea f. sp. 'multigermtubi']|uniref:Nucleic acid-binding, OB-fold protein n=1 Tax=Marssonina brunnea f. sp. multigermtubi (strain MB_m1) TaxID=1072389 RepID=K1Y5F5_MARBU|nr:uncharacterized protein MBM_01101 [Drepanopeziza brunnea f. sp. 'multigermtubi' MB_m1]EKD20419.1 hypothetical protein MBM_01101 [Drepanopeziza brunnea f. sp. 'multigermtubi' MB_m1]KAJ5042903.1 hypothetical protein L3040_004294 [Drepanopeziza brunnea f. sp. 'multigermtubi']